MMTKEEQNIAVAQSLGWTFDADGYWYHNDIEMRRRLNLTSGCRPNYHGDLNACAEMEKSLNGQQQINYGYALDRVVFAKGYIPTLATRMHIIHANAPQRVEAYLRTRGLWRD